MTSQNQLPMFKQLGLTLIGPHIFLYILNTRNQDNLQDIKPLICASKEFELLFVQWLGKALLQSLYPPPDYSTDDRYPASCHWLTSGQLAYLTKYRRTWEANPSLISYIQVIGCRFIPQNPLNKCIVTVQYRNQRIEFHHQPRNSG